MNIAIHFKVLKEDFIIIPYQIYAAAQLASGKDQYTALKMASGQGKTYVIFMLAKFLLNSGKKVVIVVLNIMLRFQMI